MEVGQSIKKIREWKNYSQKYMANELKTTQQNYARYESGQTEIGVSKLQKIAEILEVPITYLFELDEKAIFNNYKVENRNEGEGNHFGNIIRDTELLQELKEQYEKRIEELKTQFNMRIEEMKIHTTDLKKEIAYLKNILDKTLKD